MWPLKSPPVLALGETPALEGNGNRSVEQPPPFVLVVGGVVFAVALVRQVALEAANANSSLV